VGSLQALAVLAPLGAKRQQVEQVPRVARAPEQVAAMTGEELRRAERQAPVDPQEAAVLADRVVAALVGSRVGSLAAAGAVSLAAQRALRRCLQ
jgi:hypothetical protein